MQAHFFTDNTALSGIYLAQNAQTDYRKHNFAINRYNSFQDY